ncbi:MAG TPA: primosomal protein N' [Candidatus Saccharimonadales bacterium]|jgi:primosomal protein N' (replication factor Y)|nr:primosomal protein N' [Candidatus Saccharimonadales bacterium]
MHYYEVAPNQIIRATSDSFTYASETILSIGTLVLIEVGKKSLTGIILREVSKPSYETKPISAIIEDKPLPEQLVALAQWLSTYYATHLATVLQTILPRGVQKSRRERKIVARETLRDRTNIVFTPDQNNAITTVEDATPGTILLHGVTGSGKTHVYIELAKRTLDRGQSVVLLVPEIALTSQLVDEFSHHFENTILTHSRQTEAERHAAWRDALYSNQPRIVIGPRSALFLPLHSVGMIIIDEAHEPSFKQEQSPRYSALRAASVLASYHKAKVILGSATPAIADYYLAEKSERPIITMSNRARDNAVAPTISLVDMTKRANFKKHRFISDKLLVQLAETFASGSQALVFHNRRGSASTTLCENCAWSAMCQRCFIPLTLHADKHHLRCHVCGVIENVPTSCPECGAADIIHKGIGTKLIESELRKLFPDKNIARFDGDSESGESIEQKYKELYNGEIDLIIGTQVIAKGLDLPKLRTVGVIQADSGLSLPDYGASERTFQLLAQVIGRVGRSHHATNVIVQSYQPTHPAVVDGLAQDYTAFYEATLVERQRSHFPPFTYLLKLTCIYKTETAAVKNAQKLAQTLRAKSIPDVQILGPTPAFYERQHDTYRWQLTLKSPKRSELVAILPLVPPTHWQYELDPISLL